MEALSGVLIGTQLVFTVIAGLYFYTNLKSQQSSKSSITEDSKGEIERLNRMRDIKLSKPLSEKTRPESFEEIIGQEKGIKAIKAAIYGANPQHVIIYGPPGVGKTAAARLALKNAKASKASPFSSTAPFIEVDATILQFDERSIADPLIGSVHDPIYQGAGAYGQAGVPQPKPGAVTRAHGGILFIDEIGELHQIQMNKLLKVLEDRKVFLTSSYYSSKDKNVPRHIHDMFLNGLPADFRLIGATTRRPQDIPDALRSRCTEVFFRALKPGEVCQIAANALKKSGVTFESEIPSIISKYSSNGRDTVNIVQSAVSMAALENRTHIKIIDLEEVLELGRYTPNLSREIISEQKIGVVNGLGLSGNSSGMIMEIEAMAKKSQEKGKGILKVTGIIEEEELNNGASKMKRRSTARGSVENAITVLTKITSYNLNDYDIHLNFPGGIPIDGPSAGIAIFTAIYSAITDKEVDSKIAMTGEITLKGKIHPVGGVMAKIEAAMEAGAEKVFIPKSNYQKSFDSLKIEIICVENILEVISEVFAKEEARKNFNLRTAALVAK